MVFLFIRAEAMVVRLGTLAPLKTPIRVLTVVVQSASTLLSIDVISGSVPVSYTHLDVYKRQDVRCDGNCNDGFYIDWMFRK